MSWGATTSSDPPVVAVTGATGGLGGRVAGRLADRGVSQRLVVRDPSRAPDLPGTEVAVASYDDPAAMVEAFTGIPTLFLVSAAEHPQRVRQHLAAVDAAAEAGVERVVYTSFVAASPDATFTFARHHALTEDRVREHGLRHTFLRDSLYLDYLPLMAGEEGIIRGPAGDGRVAPVSRDDIAEVAVACLLSDGHDGQTYDLTGPDLATLAELADVLTEAAGRPVVYQPETVEEAYASRAGFGAPDFEVEGWVTSYLAVATGELAIRSDAVERLTGHPPVGLREHLARHPELLERLRT